MQPCKEINMESAAAQQSRRSLPAFLRRATILLAIAALSADAGAQLKGDCWVKTKEDIHVDAGLTIKSPEVAPLYQALQVIDGIIKKNPYFVTLPDMRYRNHIYIGGGAPRIAQLNSIAYNRSGWTGECDLIPQADRIDAGDAGVSFAINQLHAILLPKIIHDEQLEAYVEPVLNGHIAGNPLYNKYYVLLSLGNRLPWIPLAVAEYLDFGERDLKRRIAGFEKTKAERKEIDIDEAEVQKFYEELKKTSTSAAEEYRKAMLSIKQQAPEWGKKAQQQDQEIGSRLQEELASLRRFRASLSRRELQAQARVGSGKFGLAAPEDHNPQALVKPDPAFGWDSSDPNRIQLIVVFAPYLGDLNAHPYNIILHHTLETLDYTALRSLLR